jgi:glutaredoxin 3
MRPVTIYTTDTCPYCVRAKAVLKQHDVPFTEIDVTGDDERRRWLVEASGQRTVPQIFFGAESIGGCTDLEAVVARGELNAKLAG